jgi:hypothetical protein
MLSSASPTDWRYSPWLSPAASAGLEGRSASGKNLPTDQYYLRPEEIMSDAGRWPDDWQQSLLRGQRTQTLPLRSGQSSPSSRGRRDPAKSGQCVRCAGGVI